MKNQIILLFRIVVIVLLSFIFSNCEKDEVVSIEEPQQFDKVQVKTFDEVSSTAINFIKTRTNNSFKVSDYKGTIRLVQSTNNAENSNLGTVDTNKEIVVHNEESIKHTFKVIDSDNDYKTMTNLIIVEKGDIVYEYFLKYTIVGDTSIYNEDGNIDFSKFNGTIETFDKDGQLVGSISVDDGLILNQEGDISPCSDIYTNDTSSTSTGNNSTTSSSSNSAGIDGSDTGSTSSPIDNTGNGGWFASSDNDDCGLTWSYARCGCGGDPNGHAPSGPDCCEGSPLTITDCNGNIVAQGRDQNIATLLKRNATDPCGDGSVGVILNDLVILYDEFTDEQRSWLEANPEFVGTIEAFLAEHGITEENLTIIYLTLEIAMSDNLLTPYNQETLNIINDNWQCCGWGFPTGLSGFSMAYQQGVIEQMQIIMLEEYPEGHQFTKWEIFKIIIKAQKEYIHYALDAGGMAPVVGIFFDVTNAVVYALETDWTNMTISLGAAIPFGGQWVTAAKWARKTVILANGKKVYLKIYNLANGFVKFSNRSQLRKILGLTDSAIHAHHIIPYSQGFHQLVQAAAKSIRSWHINDIFNGIPMPKNLHLSGHQAYTDAIITKLDEIKDAIDITNLDEAYDALMSFCNYIKEFIVNNPHLSSGELVNYINSYNHIN